MNPETYIKKDEFKNSNNEDIEIYSSKKDRKIVIINNTKKTAKEIDLPFLKF